MADETTMITPKEERALEASERFALMVQKEFSGNVSGALEINDAQKKLIQGYFIIIDKALKTAEENRKLKNEKNKDHEKYDNTLPVTWSNVDMVQLAIDLVYFARLGLDMQREIRRHLRIRHDAVRKLRQRVFRGRADHRREVRDGDKKHCSKRLIHPHHTPFLRSRRQYTINEGMSTYRKLFVCGKNDSEVIVCDNFVAHGEARRLFN